LDSFLDLIEVGNVPRGKLIGRPESEIEARRFRLC